MRQGMAEAWRLGAGLIDGRMQVSGCGVGRSRLRGVLLGLAQLGRRGGQGDELGMSAMAISVVSPVRFPAKAIIRAIRRSWSPSWLRQGSRPYRARAARS